jgi:hypothetical protein
VLGLCCRCFLCFSMLLPCAVALVCSPIFGVTHTRPAQLAAASLHHGQPVQLRRERLRKVLVEKCNNKLQSGICRCSNSPCMLEDSTYKAEIAQHIN